MGKPKRGPFQHRNWLPCTSLNCTRQMTAVRLRFGNLGVNPRHGPYRPNNGGTSKRRTALRLRDG